MNTHETSRVHDDALDPGGADAKSRENRCEILYPLTAALVSEHVARLFLRHLVHREVQLLMMRDAHALFLGSHFRQPRRFRFGRVPRRAPRHAARHARLVLRRRLAHIGGGLLLRTQLLLSAPPDGEHLEEGVLEADWVDLSRQLVPRVGHLKRGAVAQNLDDDGRLLPLVRPANAQGKVEQRISLLCT
eukprot:scaffold22828_cov72-Phaeocystis_antarctica.AAC.3